MDEVLGNWAASFPGAGLYGREPLPAVWCSWYCLRDRVTAAGVLGAARSAQRRRVPCQVFQVDDGWQPATGDWWADRERFGDLEGLARGLGAEGLELGLWVAPFVAAEGSETARRHPDWYLPNVDAGRNWNGRIRVLDLTREAAMAHLTGQLAELAGLGVSYFKLDFLYAGALDGAGIEPYRRAMESIRVAIGKRAQIVACGAPLLPTVGLADAVRVGPDTAENWDPPGGDLSQPSGRSAVVVSRARAFTHGRWWTNDPDCLLARPGVERRGPRARHLGHLAGMVSSGDLPDDLDRWGLAVTRKLLHHSVPGPAAPTEPMPPTET
jgi:alpha-galactosidase